MADNILSITGLNKAFGSRTIFSGLTLGLNAGEKLGLIGDNGTGKSTLLKIIAGLDRSDGGSVAMRQGLRVSFLAQVPVLRDVSIREILSEPFAALQARIAEYEACLAAGKDGA